MLDIGECYFFFQAEDGIRDIGVTGVQTCALPIYINNKTIVRMAAGAAINKLTLNLSLISTPCVLVAAIVVSEITDKLSPNIAPPITAAKIKAIETPLFSPSPTAMGPKATIAPTEVPVAVEIKAPITKSPTAIY